MAQDFSVQVMVAGKVSVAIELPFGNGCGVVRGSGLFVPSRQRFWLPVCSFLVTTPHGRLLFDTGWNRNMSPDGVYDAKAQIRSLDSAMLYRINQGVVGPGQTVPEQLAQQGLSPADIDYVVISHLDCDHVNGLRGLKGARHVLVSADEMRGATEFGHNPVRFRPVWWHGMDVETFGWNGTEGPVLQSHDLFGDGSVVLVHIPGHTKGQVAMKVTNADGDYVLLFADGGYGKMSWQQMIASGISVNKVDQRAALEWIREQSLDSRCIRSIACHDYENRPETISF